MWHYEEKGTRQGPVTESRIAELIQSRVINYDTLVWRNGFPDWKRISDTELQPLMNRMGPPPLTGNKVNNFFIWVLAFAPIIGEFLRSIIIGVKAGMEHVPNIYLEGYVLAHRYDYWYVTLIINIILCWFDERQLKKAGHDTSRFSAWMILVPVYIYKRTVLLRQSMACLIVWIISCVLSAILF